MLLEQELAQQLPVLDRFDSLFNYAKVF